MSKVTPSASIRLPRIFPLPAADGKCTLYCLPCAGSSAAMYGAWQSHAPAGLSVCPVEYPGHGARSSEQLTSDADSICEQITDAILKRQSGPFALFGHSVGSALLWRVADLMHRRGAASGLRMVAVSGRAAPTFLDTNRRLHDLPHDRFMVELKRYSGLPAEVQDNPEFLDFFMPILRNDFCMNEAMYEYRLPRLDTPLIAFSGAEDGDTNSPGAMDAWAGYSTRWLGHHQFSGGHFYLRDAEITQSILSLIGARLLEEESTLAR